MKHYIAYFSFIIVAILATGIVVYAASPEQRVPDDFAKSDWQRIVTEWSSLKNDSQFSPGELAPYEERFTHIAAVRYGHEIEKIVIFYTRLRKDIMRVGLEETVEKYLLAYVDGELVWYDVRSAMLMRASDVSTLTTIISDISARWTSSPEAIQQVSDELRLHAVQRELRETVSIARQIDQAVEDMNMKGYDVSGLQEVRSDVRNHINASQIALDNAAGQEGAEMEVTKQYLEVSVDEMRKAVESQHAVIISLRDMFPDVVMTIVPGVPTRYPALVAPY